MKYDIVVIGSGIGGLECALFLAKRGMRVIVLERQQHPGGCLQSYRRHGEYLDTGMHCVGGIGEGGVLYGPFRYLGLTDLPWHRLDSLATDRITIANKTYIHAEGYEAFADTLAQAFPKEREGLNRYVGLMRNICSHMYDSLLPHDAADFFTQSLFARGAYDYLHETFNDELLINILSGSSIKMELARNTLPLYSFACINNSFIQGTYRLRGPGNVIVQRLIEQIEENGGKVVCNAEVDELVERDGRIIAARCTNGEVYEGCYFISDAHPAITVGMVKESALMRQIYRKRILRLENTHGMFTTTLIIKPGMLRYFNWNQYIYSRPNTWTFFNEPGPVQGVMVSCRCPDNPSDDARIIDILTPLPWCKVSKWDNTTVGHRSDGYKDMKQQLYEECVALAEQFIPNLSNMIEAHYESTPLTYRDYTLSPQGSSYGVRKDYNNTMMTLLSVKTPIPNLLLTGQSLTLHGLLGVTMTSLLTVSEIIGRESAWKITQTGN